MSGARERLASVAYAHYVRSSGPGFIECSCGWTGVFHPDHVADSALPVVQALVAEGQAEALETAANHGVCLIDIFQLRDKAAALRATTSGEGAS